MIETVVLKNGATEALSLVSITMFSLSNLLKQKPMCFYELVMKCRDKEHKIWGNLAVDLKELSLIQRDENVHSSIKNIVLSAVEGEGLNMTIGDPKK